MGNLEDQISQEILDLSFAMAKYLTEGFVIFHGFETDESRSGFVNVITKYHNLTVSGKKIFITGSFNY